MEKGVGYEEIDHETIIAHLFYLCKVFTLNFSGRLWGVGCRLRRRGRLPIGRADWLKGALIVSGVFRAGCGRRRRCSFRASTSLTRSPSWPPSARSNVFRMQSTWSVTAVCIPPSRRAASLVGGGASTSLAAETCACSACGACACSACGACAGRWWKPPSPPQGLTPALEEENGAARAQDRQAEGIYCHRPQAAGCHLAYPDGGGCRSFCCAREGCHVDLLFLLQGGCLQPAALL